MGRVIKAEDLVKFLGKRVYMAIEFPNEPDLIVTGILKFIGSYNTPNKIYKPSRDLFISIWDETLDDVVTFNLDDVSRVDFDNKK